MRTRPRIAFYAPMKAPDHPRPSGDRQIARLTMQALDRAGYAPAVASRLRILDTEGDEAVQSRLLDEAAAEADRLIAELAADPPALWFTYHCHYKAPDLLGPVVANVIGLPYAISEPSVSPRRREGKWAEFARLSETAIARADLLFWTTERDRPALAEVGHGERMIELAPFLETGPDPGARAAGRPLSLLTVAMMRPGDKAESYRRLAAALAHLPGDWRLTVIGHGPAEAEVMARFAGFGDRVTHIGDIEDPGALRPHYEAADLLVWPGVNEGVGMVWLEAQAAGLPVVAEDGPAARAVAPGAVLGAPDDPWAFAAAISEAADRREALSRAARAHVEDRHGIGRAAATLGAALGRLVR